MMCQLLTIQGMYNNARYIVIQVDAGRYVVVLEIGMSPLELPLDWPHIQMIQPAHLLLPPSILTIITPAERGQQGIKRTRARLPTARRGRPHPTGATTARLTHAHWQYSTRSAPRMPASFRAPALPPFPLLLSSQLRFPRHPPANIYPQADPAVVSGGFFFSFL